MVMKFQYFVIFENFVTFLDRSSATRLPRGKQYSINGCAVCIESIGDTQVVMRLDYNIQVLTITYFVYYILSQLRHDSDVSVYS